MEECITAAGKNCNKCVHMQYTLFSILDHVHLLCPTLHNREEQQYVEPMDTVTCTTQNTSSPIKQAGEERVCGLMINAIK